MAKGTPTKRISARLTPRLEQHLRNRALLTGQTESDIIREALEAHFAQPPARSALTLAKSLGLVGCAKGLPADLSTNKKYFEGFGTASKRA